MAKRNTRKKEMKMPKNAQELPSKTIHLLEPMYLTRSDDAHPHEILMLKAPVSQIVGFSSDLNVRQYHADVGFSRKMAHRAIGDTMRYHPADFFHLHSGIAIRIESYSTNGEGKLTIRVVDPRIMDGSQTEGEARALLAILNDLAELGANVRLEIHVLPFTGVPEEVSRRNKEKARKITEARNTSNRVKPVSILGRGGEFDELEKVLQEKIEGFKLQKSETDTPEQGHVPAVDVLRALFALMPDDLWNLGCRKPVAKSFIYRQDQLFKKYKRMLQESRDLGHKHHEAQKARYQFFLDFASQAMEIFDLWKVHPGFLTMKKSCKVEAIKTDGRGNIVKVPEGIYLPALTALSIFVKETPSGWEYAPPKEWDDGTLIDSLGNIFKGSGSRNPTNMGKTRQCYEQAILTCSAWLQGHQSKLQ